MLDGLDLARPELLSGQSLIDGAWTDCERVIPVINPATGRKIGDVGDCGAHDAERAVAAASRALPGWRAIAPRTRQAALLRWRELILANAEDLARILTAEQGKPLVEARGEIHYAASFLEWFAEEAKRAYGDIIPGHQPDKRLLVLREPVGVVGAITPWNFPAAMITRKVGPALAVGCTMVLKPSELTPYTALALARLAVESALIPPGVFNVVVGEAEPIGAVLTQDPRVRKFSFTGSTAVGKMLGARCMSTVKRVSLELGGNAPFIVFDDADLGQAVEGAIASKFRNTGQTCVCANRLLVQSGVYSAFAEHLAERVSELAVGDGLKGQMDQGPLINEAALRKVERHVEDARAGGASALTGGHALPGEGCFYAPTVLVDVAPDALLCREETFGPVAGLVRFETEAEAIGLANEGTAGLASYLYTRDLDRAFRVTEALRYGMVGVNTGLISTEVAPFGGVRESGLGREGARQGLDDYLDYKLMCLGLAPDPGGRSG
ncbi:MAG: succinate-semialdehyde dehydrogenase (NADP(+)) [Phenylobacterium sp. RIFCSPHIGHO2_01_FULL_69_31]|uniref:NAD-dependent succinate-semialdehyde dehydrogenase n=1 Tax=unclassified Phenylobacterium TaxID=2640670 RepID=UPI0008D29126|nr:MULTISPECIES: NAD-dependent succinate-semialdehyde dehydrogenase [unclassified Phenylobacterium]OHB26876.1 MAG: succinate-semialdehyde dehydrogenase (NADP(+)) [Phenylobacterium sp. RIFCSPHIGHO2_01_FULL_69_31]TAJ69379.1 MAG: NAD-dependent succinate-semialdehyde dehydrogenase [Phenylobacterium sp.]